MTTPAPPPSPAAPWPRAGGMMGRLVREKDWSLTPLGPVDDWLADLRVVVNLVLESPVPLVLLWGPDLVQIYNDGYALIAAAKHPAALGQPTRECWPELWHFNAPVYQAVWRGESRAFTAQPLTLERHGVPEEAWFDLNFSPVRTAAGAVGGVLVTVVETTATVRARQIERQAEERLTAVLESTTDCVLVLDRDWTIVYENRRAIDLVNQGRALIGSNLWDAFPEAVGSRFWHEYHRAMETQEPVAFTAFLGSQGRWFEVHAYPSPDQLALFFRDATAERRQAEELRRTQEQLALALVSGGVATWVWDIPADRVRADQAMADLTGIDPDRLRAGVPLATVFASVHPDDRPEVDAALARTRETGADYMAEYRVRGVNGVRWVLARGRCERDADGRQTRLSGAMVDVSERRQAQEALQASEARLRAVLDQMPVGVALAAMPSGELTYHNSRAVELLGHPMRPADNTAGYARYGALHASGQPFSPEEYPMARTVLREEAVAREEMLYLRGDGTTTHLEVSSAPIRDAAGRAVMAISTFDDIAERKQTEERQRLLMREVDHRAKNVLSVVQAVMQLTRADTVEAFVKAVGGRVQALARAHSLLAQGRWTGAELRALVEEELAPYVTEDTARLRVSGGEVRVTADTAQPLTMVLHELATNAAKYGALSAPDGRLDVAWQPEDDGGLRLEWTEFDGPPVLPPERTGFGSELIRATADRQLCGGVELEWRPVGLHCVLTIGADCLVGRPGAGGPTTDRGLHQGATGGLMGRRILVVEDDALLGIAVKTTLESLGCIVVGPVGTVEAALQMAATEAVDAAVLDLNLMGRQSLAVADVLEAREVPHLFATGYNAEGLRHRGRPVLEKPYTMDRLEGVLRAVLGPTAAAQDSIR